MREVVRAATAVKNQLKSDTDSEIVMSDDLVAIRLSNALDALAALKAEGEVKSD
jgi:hypothetical protein